MSDRRAVTTPPGSLTDGVRRSLEDAKSQAERNIEYLDGQTAKAEREIERQQGIIESNAVDRAENEAALRQAEAMLSGE